MKNMASVDKNTSQDSNDNGDILTHNAVNNVDEKPSVMTDTKQKEQSNDNPYGIC